MPSGAVRPGWPSKAAARAHPKTYRTVLTDAGWPASQGRRNGFLANALNAQKTRMKSIQRFPKPLLRIPLDSDQGRGFARAHYS
jgi:hypothetical protein